MASRMSLDDGPDASWCTPRSSALPLRALNHVSRVCRDVRATARFYRDLLGFTLIKRPSSLEFEGAWLWHMAFGIGLHLIAGEPLQKSSVINPKADHLSFQTDSLDAVEARLDAAGVQHVKGKVCEAGVMVTQLFFHDPDNNMIEICNCDLLPVEPLAVQLSRELGAHQYGHILSPTHSLAVPCTASAQQQQHDPQEESMQGPVAYPACGPCTATMGPRGCSDDGSCMGGVNNSKSRASGLSSVQSMATLMAAGLAATTPHTATLRRSASAAAVHPGLLQPSSSNSSFEAENISELLLPQQA